MDLSPLFISVKTAISSILIAFLAGIIAARISVIIKNNFIKTMMDCLLTLPLVLPPTAIGFLLLITFGVNRPVGQFLFNFFGYKITFTWEATVLAAVVVSFPIMYRSARGAFEQIDENFVFAARTLGLSESWIFWRIVLPLSLPGLTSGCILAFVRGLGEFGATAMIAGNISGKTRTLPLAIYSSAASGDMKTGGTYALIIIIISFFSIAVMNWITIKKPKYLRQEKNK